MSTNPAQPFYDRISHAYDLIADGGEHTARERGLELSKPTLDDSVFEIGFGTGHSLQAVAVAVGESGSVSGVDISSGMKNVASKRLSDAGLAEKISLVVADVPPLPYEDAAFDAVSMSFTLKLFRLETIPAVLAECRRVLKPGGRLGVVSMATVEDGNQESVLERTYVWMHAHFPHIVDCQPISLEDMVADAGFTLAEQERMNLFTMPVTIVVGTNQ